MSRAAVTNSRARSMSSRLGLPGSSSAEKIRLFSWCRAVTGLGRSTSDGGTTRATTRLTNARSELRASSAVMPGALLRSVCGSSIQRLDSRDVGAAERIRGLARHGLTRGLSERSHEVTVACEVLEPCLDRSAVARLNHVPVPPVFDELRGAGRRRHDDG